MAWRDWIPWGRSGSSLAAEGAAPDHSDFTRGALDPGGMGLHELAAAIMADGDDYDPRAIPFEVLCWMALDPVIYLGEQAATAPVKDPELYFVEHKDPAIQSEVEEWLWPILPDVLQAIVRAIPFGAMPYVFDWTVQDLPITIASEGQPTQDRVLAAHQHFSAVHEISPGTAQIELDLQNTEKLQAVVFEGRRYGVDRAFVSVWDREFGKWTGHGSRRRAHKWWRRSIRTDRYEARYLERSVDPPRVGYAPQGLIEIEGKKVQATKLLASALMALKNGGATVVPSELDPESKAKLWEVDVLDLPDRSEVWQRVANRFDALKLYACLAPPTVIGVDEATFASARITDKMFVEFEQSIARFVARELTKVAAAVHVVMHGTKIRPPEIKAGALPQSKEKLYLDVFRVVAGVERRLKDGRRVSMAEQVKDGLLDLMKLPKAKAEEVARDPDEPLVMVTGPQGPGPDRQATGDRQDRRDVAREPEGENATGGPNDGVAGALRAAATELARANGRADVAEAALAREQRRPVELRADLHAHLDAKVDAKPDQPTIVPAPVVHVAAPVVNLQNDVHVPAAAPAPPPPAPVIENHVHVPEQPAPKIENNVEVYVPEAKPKSFRLERDTEGGGFVGRIKPEA